MWLELAGDPLEMEAWQDKGLSHSHLQHLNCHCDLLPIYTIRSCLRKPE